LNIFFTKFQKRAQEEEKIRHINLILALNSKKIPQLPIDIRAYIFGFTKALLEKRRTRIFEAFYLEQKSCCNIQKCIEKQSI
jgi:hypothetical protein